MREDQSKRNQMNPGEDNTQWSDKKSLRDQYQTSSYDRMDQDQDSRGPGRSYRTDDYYNRVSNQSNPSSQYGQDSSQTPYERASYGRDMSDNFSGGQRGRESGFGQSNQQDRSYGQQYGRPNSSSQYSSSQPYQPRGADQGSYGQDSGANSRYQGGYPYGYDANNSQLSQSDRSRAQYDQSQYGRDQEYRQQGQFQNWDNDRQNYRGNEAQRSIYGSAGFGSLGTGNDMVRHERHDYNARNAGVSTTYHPDAHYGQVSGTSFSSSYDSMDRSGLTGKQTPASYSGKGPKSFKRSDERIREEISEIFTRHHEVDASDVEIEVKDGEVTLSGFVPERRMKYLAEDLAEKSMGVKDVTNNLRVRREAAAYSESITSESAMSASEQDKSDKKLNVPGTSPSSKKSSTLNPNH